MSRRGAFLVGALGAELFALSCMAALGDLRAQSITFLMLFAAATAAFTCAFLLLHERPPLKAIVVIAIALRVPMLLAQPSLSDDVWRYVHDGRTQLAGTNPYAMPPADERTRSFRGPEYSRINHPQLVTIYPPAAQLSFLANARLGSSLLGWRIMLIGAELVLFMALAGLLARRDIGPANLALYAWHPLAVIEGVGSAHLEPIGIALLLVGLLLAERGRAVAAGIALGISTGIKLVAAPLLLATEHSRAPKICAAAVVTLLLLYLPYALSAQPFGSLVTFSVRWEANASIYSLLAWLTDGHRARILAATLLACLLVLLHSSRLQSADRLAACMLAILLLSPVVHPWYLLWLLAFIPLVTRHWLRWPALAWSVTVPLAYLPGALRWLEYAPVFVILVATATAARRDFRLRTSVPSAGKTQQI